MVTSMWRAFELPLVYSFVWPDLAMIEIAIFGVLLFVMALLASIPPAFGLAFLFLAFGLKLIFSGANTLLKSFRSGRLRS